MINLRKLEESIILITSAGDRKQNVIGTGFAFYQSQNYTYLLTCAHVFQDMGGEENIRVNNLPVELVAMGDAQGFDLAVLKVKYVFPPLTLMILYGEEERSFKVKIPGYYLWGQNYARRRRTIAGKMIVEVDGERAFQLIENMPEDVAVGKLEIEQGKLKPGYSGSPIIDIKTGLVVGVTTHMEGEQNLGKFGTAISIEALEKIWREMPTDVSQQIKREILENSDNLPVEETQVEILENSDNLSIEETKPKILESSNNLSVEETKPKILESSNNLSVEETKPEILANSDNLSLEETEFDVITINRKGEEINRRSHKARFFTEDLGNDVILEMVSIPGGTFFMGSPENEEGRYDDESPQHQVTLQPFYMSKYPITQDQYQAIMGKNPSNFQGKKRPVECVSWYDAAEFCQKLSQKTGKNYRLPSESQWEYACRAGTTTPFYFGETITTDLVNYNGNYPYGNAPKGIYRQQTTDVGSFPPNAFGLYDMHGNVWEWCADNWHYNYQDAPSDGSAWLKNDEKKHIFLLRGGSWIGYPIICRSAYRSFNVRRDYLTYTFGFRLVCASGRTL